MESFCKLSPKELLEKLAYYTNSKSGSKKAVLKFLLKYSHQSEVDDNVNYKGILCAIFFAFKHIIDLILCICCSSHIKSQELVGVEKSKQKS